MDIINSYCRLCAKFKPRDKQLELDSYHDRKADIIQMLVRVNAATDFETFLPKTICFVCINALHKAYDFVLKIEHAQVALSEIFSLGKVKNEIDSEGEENQQASNFVKVEYAEDNNSDHHSNRDNTSVSETPQQAELEKSINIEEYSDIDSIPLSKLSRQKLSWSSYSWVCRHCDTRFSNINELQSHSMQCHNICNPYRCADCKTRKFKLSSFLTHVQMHHKHLRSSCYKCFKHFEHSLATRRHLKTHLTKHFCPGCHASFASNEELKKHTDTYTQITLSRPRPIPEALQTDGLTCKVCQKTFKSKTALNSHLLIHTDRKKDNICDICGKGFFVKYNLESHMLLHTDVKPYKCEICSTAFKTARLLKNHVPTHNNTRPYSCDQCGKRFRIEKQLKSHSIIHTDIHPYPCPFCSKRFRFKSILNNHVRIHTGDRPYTCEFCQRNFTNWSNYNKHMKRKHNIDKSRKKHTPDGVYPIDPTTGALIKSQETNQIIEWKKKMLVPKGRGRPPIGWTKDQNEETCKVTIT